MPAAEFLKILVTLSDLLQFERYTLTFEIFQPLTIIQFNIIILTQSFWNIWTKSFKSEEFLIFH